MQISGNIRKLILREIDSWVEVEGRDIKKSYHVQVMPGRKDDKSELLLSLSTLAEGTVGTGNKILRTFLMYFSA